LGWGNIWGQPRKISTSVPMSSEIGNRDRSDDVIEIKLPHPDRSNVVEPINAIQHSKAPVPLLNPGLKHLICFLSLVFCSSLGGTSRMKFSRVHIVLTARRSNVIERADVQTRFSILGGVLGMATFSRTKQTPTLPQSFSPLSRL
jgi:hypothetical protein